MSLVTTPSSCRSARARQRREIARAIRGELELEPPRGLARIRALTSEVGELERARMTALARALERPQPAASRRLASRR
ncbi:MAG: hypothetical protein LC720_05750 [Actinobacteria bacterium]|nr:hypothetical protein [Actinomycetota bacterium]